MLRRSVVAGLACMFLLIGASTRSHAQCPDPGWDGGVRCLYDPLDLGSAAGTSAHWTGAPFNDADALAPSITAPGNYTVSVVIDGQLPACTYHVTVPNVQAALSATVNGTPVNITTNYGSDLPVFALCGPALDATFQFTNASTPGQPAGADWGGGWGPFPPAQITHGPGLTFISFAAEAQGCLDTIRYGVLVGNNAGIIDVSLDLADSTQLCIGGLGAEFVVSDPGDPNPPGTAYLIRYGAPPFDYDTVFAPAPATFHFPFPASSCGQQLAPPLNGNGYTVSAVPLYGCNYTLQDNAVSPIYVSEPPIAGFNISDPSPLCTGVPVLVTDASSGDWITVNGVNATCLDPIIHWSLSGTVNTDWTLTGSLGGPGTDPDTPLAWDPGSGMLQVVFINPGTYTLTQWAGGSPLCSIDSTRMDLCVEAPVLPTWAQPSSTVFCLPGDPSFVPDNTTSLQSFCSPNTFHWSAAVQPLCGATQPAVFSDPDVLEPTITFPAPGTYTIDLVADNLGCGPHHATPVQFTVYQAPVITPPPLVTACDGSPFALDADTLVTGCPSASLTFHWSWTVGGMPFTDEDAQLGPVDVSGPTDITLQVSSPECGNAIEVLTVVPATTPDALPSAMDASLCPSDTLHLSAAAGAATYAWSGPGGFSSHAQAPTVPPVWDAGWYVLTAATGNCADRDSVLVTRFNAPVLPPIADGLFCPGQDTVLLSASGADDYTWTWSGGTSTQNPLPVTPTMSPPFTVVGLENANGCTSAPLTVDVTLSNVSADAQAPDTSCTGGTSFTNAGTGGGTYLWDFGTGDPGDTSVVEEPTFDYQLPGTYMVTLTVAPYSQCPVVDSVRVTINAAPLARFHVSDTIVCDDQEVLFLNEAVTVGATYTWTIGNDPPFIGTTPPVRTFPGLIGQANRIPVALEASIPGCPPAVSRDTIVVQPDPSAFLGFTYGNEGCSPVTVTFVNNSISNDAVDDTLHFGDGSAPLTPFPNGTPVSHVYTTGDTPGTYTATLHTFNACGDSITTVDMTIAPANVTAFFEPPAPICLGDELCVTSPVQGAQTWSWRFGDIATAATPTACFTFPQAGTFAVTLTVEGLCGSDTWTDNVVVHPLPTAHITATPTSICAGESVAFQAAPDGMAQYQWAFGDGDSSLVQRIDHPFISSGPAMVTLVVTDAHGCTAADGLSIAISPVPVPVLQAFPDSGCVPFMVAFNAGASTSTDQFSWTFGNGDGSFSPTPVVTYDTAGTYLVTLSLQNSGGCRAERSFQVVALPVPVPMFTALVPYRCVGDDAAVTVRFDNTSTGGGSYSWTFGNGSTSISTEPSTTYDHAGTYTVVLTDSTAFCGAAHDTDLVFLEQPRAIFEPMADPLCAGRPILFTNLSTNSIAWNWEFGAWGSSDLFSPSDTFPLPGVHLVTLIAYQAGGCSDTLTLPITVCASPTAGIGVERVRNNAFQFTYTGEGASEWSWDFGDDRPSTERDPFHAFGPVPGTCDRYVRQSVLNECGCTAQTDAQVRAPFEGMFTAANSFSPNNDEKNNSYKIDFDPIYAPALGRLGYTFRVFSRWGNELFFETHDPMAEWDGTYNGEPVPQGVYQWTLEIAFPCVDAGTPFMRGDVTLWR